MKNQRSILDSLMEKRLSKSSVVESVEGLVPDEDTVEVQDTEEENKEEVKEETSESAKEEENKEEVSTETSESAEEEVKEETSDSTEEEVSTEENNENETSESAEEEVSTEGIQESEDKDSGKVDENAREVILTVTIDSGDDVQEVLDTLNSGYAEGKEVFHHVGTTKRGKNKEITAVYMYNGNHASRWADKLVKELKSKDSLEASYLLD